MSSSAEILDRMHAHSDERAKEHPHDAEHVVDWKHLITATGKDAQAVFKARRGRIYNLQKQELIEANRCADIIDNPKSTSNARKDAADTLNRLPAWQD
ncbi:hypothetical protein JCM11641_000198 [Rhodosporidiobolus odoratus]